MQAGGRALCKLSCANEQSENTVFTDTYGEIGYAGAKLKVKL
jgi:hypothetical protein